MPLPDLLPRKFRVPARILEESQQMLADLGRQGFEAVVVWVGRRARDSVSVEQALRPAQIARRSPYGCTVEVPEDAISDLIRVLDDDSFLAVRLHTHPSAAFHSRLDDANMLIGHIGAISIVVPHFARDAIDLTVCSVNELGPGGCWRALPMAEVLERFIVGD